MRTVRPSTEEIDRLRLIRTEGIGPVTYRRLLAHCGSPDAALQAAPNLARTGGRQGPMAIPGRDEIVHEIERTTELGGRFLFLGAPAYPRLLASMYDAPPCLIVQGDPNLPTLDAVGVVGGRNASSNGLRIAEQLADELAEHLVVVSGLARGIDTAAHRGALARGRTVAVVAGGLDCPYPTENAALQARIAMHGAVVTEAPLGTTPLARHFPRRNRIIAGLSLGIVVVEAALRSGSLITARIAQENGREVFAVPGSPLDPRARGGNDLIRQGAALVETADDVLPVLAGMVPQQPEGAHAVAESEFAWTSAPEVVQSASTLLETVVGLLSATPTAVDDLMRRCQLSSSAVAAALLELELAGRVESLPGGRIMLLPTVRL
jgi:DNA processing protein